MPTLLSVCRQIQAPVNECMSSAAGESVAAGNVTGGNDAYTARLASFKAALASTASRTLALYFSRPIRLFRPSKISGWHSLGGQSLPLLIKQKGWIVIPRHFFPPLFVNAFLGTVLWATYSETSALLAAYAPSTSSTTAAALSGGCAGAVQALAAAPAENVRLVLEGGRARGSWSVAWKEVFAGATPLAAHATRDEVRQVRHWVRDAREMAGRGWQGLGFGVAKDACAFAVFFAIFEVSRRTAARASAFSERVADSMAHPVAPRAKAHTARIVHSSAIVGGGLVAGVAYEAVCRPFDVARRHMHTAHTGSVGTELVTKAQEDGILSFFRAPVRAAPTGAVHAWLRTLARVGPWGVGFLVWENFGPGL